MSDRTITVTLKAGEGFAAPWVVIGGDQLDEVNYKLDQILAAGTLQKAAAVAIAFHNGYRSLRHADGAQEVPQESYSQPPVGSGPPSGYQGPPASQTAPQGDPWANQGPPPQDPWANQGPSPQWATGSQGYQAPPQTQQTQQAPPQNQGGGRPPICTCGKSMEYKNTTGGKAVWRCPDWRWNNGNPTPNHDQIWVEGNH